MKYTITQYPSGSSNRYFSKHEVWGGHNVIASWRPTINMSQLMKLKTARRLIRYSKIRYGVKKTNWKIIPVN